MKPTALAALLACLLAIDPPGGCETGLAFEVRALAPGIHAVVASDPSGLFPEANTVFLINEEDVLVIDPGGSREEAALRLAALRQLTTLPVRYVVDTHGHDDHALGNGVFRAAYKDVEIIGHVWLAAGDARGRERGRAAAVSALDRRRQLDGLLRTGVGLDGAPLASAARQAIERDAARVQAAAPVAPLPPTMPVGDRLTLRRGSRVIEILSFGAGHSPGDIVVFLPRERILIAGDLVGWPPSADRTTSVRGWVLALAGLRQLDVDVIVPGHGPVMRGWTAVERLGALLGDVDRTLRSSPAGETPDLSVHPELARWRRALAAESPLGGLLFDRFLDGAVESIRLRASTSARSR